MASHFFLFLFLSLSSSKIFHYNLAAGFWIIFSLFDFYEELSAICWDFSFFISYSIWIPHLHIQQANFILIKLIKANSG